MRAFPVRLPSGVCYWTVLDEDPVMRLARRAGLESLVTRIVTVPGGAGANAAAKVASIVAGMVAGADSILDMDALREGAVGKVLPGVKAPSTLGTFLRAFTFGHVRQLGAVAAGFLVALAQLVPLLTGHDDHRDAVTWLDTDDSMRETYGYAKQGVGYGYNKVKGLNALLGIVSAGSAPHPGNAAEIRPTGPCHARRSPSLCRPPPIDPPDERHRADQALTVPTGTAGGRN
jgi:hypothetical protein